MRRLIEFSNDLLDANLDELSLLGSAIAKRDSDTDAHIVARIFIIADVFDALTSIRPYKEAIQLEKSLKIMEKGRGSHFDPKLLDAFLIIAPGLYTNINNREIEDLRRELDALVHTCFSSSMETLQY